MFPEKKCKTCNTVFIPRTALQSFCCQACQDGRSSVRHLIGIPSMKEHEYQIILEAERKECPILEKRADDIIKAYTSLVRKAKIAAKAASEAY